MVRLRESQVKKIFILDTTVLLHDPQAIYKFKTNDILIPIVVVEEIDKFKRDQSEVGRNARTISRLLDLERSKGKLSNGVKLESGGMLYIVLHSAEIQIDNKSQALAKNNDNWILGVAFHYSKEKSEECILVTKDVNLRIKADALGIRAEDYSNDKVQVDELYSGYTTIEAEDALRTQLLAQGSIQAPDYAISNQFFCLKKDGEEELLTKFNARTNRLELIPAIPEVWGIRPRNMEQRMALDLLLDPDIQLVTLVGKAGTGKTLLAIAAGLQMVVDEEGFNRLMVGRPIHPLGKDIGYLPGDIDEKIRPWMQPIFDNLEYILHCTSDEHSRSSMTYEYFIQKGWMTVEPLTYMRGRSIPNQYMLVDEAQNLTPHEMKSIITRAGHGTKIVLTGDPEQIDNPYLDAATNGITYVVSRMKSHDLHGHVTLVQGERSELAELATNLL